MDCFHPKLNHFYLPDPVPIESYRILEKIVYGKKEIKDWNSKGIIPSAEIGDIDLQALCDGLRRTGEHDVIWTIIENKIYKKGVNNEKFDFV